MDTMRKNSALVVVDVQVDFCPGGALPVPRGDEVVGVLNKYIELFASRGRPIFATRDMHPPDTIHFRAFGGAWPPHCLKDTTGAGFHPELKLTGEVVVITKGEDPRANAYSAFDGHGPDGRSFDALLRELAITQLYVGGLATDYCVKSTVLDAIDRGFKVAVLIDATKGVEAADGDTRRALKEMDDAGAGMVTLEMLTLYPD